MLVSLVLVGCGVPQKQHDALASDLSKAQQELQSAKTELQAAQAKVSGYRVVVTDDRSELATPEQIPDADIYLPGSIDAALAAQPITSNTYVAAVTRSVLIDRAVLPKLVASPAPYIGVMGSRRRWAETKKLLLADGLEESELARIHSPLGLELNAETPEEIAVSIMAEIIMLRRGGTGARMKD